MHSCCKMGNSLTALFLPPLAKIEKDFATEAVMDWLDRYWMVSVYCSVLYLFLTYIGWQWMQHRPSFSLRRHLILWNIALATFSFYAMTAINPLLIRDLYDYGLAHTTCHSKCLTEEYKRMSVWGWLFALSKVFEFGDTVFIILRKTPLSFLHCYHHVTVCIYTWYALTSKPSALSPWFGGMNSTVHTFMYTYYAFRASGYKLHPLLPKMLTAMQLSQMLVGIVVNIMSWHMTRSGANCMFRHDLFWLAAVMYTSYALLFINFFYHRYIKKTTLVHSQSLANGIKAKLT